jgi:hypothetical protein
MGKGEYEPSFITLASEMQVPACPYGSVGDDRPATRMYAYIGSSVSLGKLIFGSLGLRLELQYLLVLRMIGQIGNVRTGAILRQLDNNTYGRVYVGRPAGGERYSDERPATCFGDEQPGGLCSRWRQRICGRA